MNPLTKGLPTYCIAAVSTPFDALAGEEQVPSSQAGEGLLLYRLYYSPNSRDRGPYHWDDLCPDGKRIKNPIWATAKRVGPLHFVELEDGTSRLGCSKCNPTRHAIQQKERAFIEALRRERDRIHGNAAPKSSPNTLRIRQDSWPAFTPVTTA